MEKPIKKLFSFVKGSIVTLQEQKGKLKAKKCFHLAPTAFYLNISRTIENRAMHVCISNDIQGDITIQNRTGCTCVVYCFDGPKQFFFNFSVKYATAALWRVVL